MIRVGVIGLGMMGLTHLDVYSRRSDVQLVAISDRNPDRLAGANRAVGNIPGQSQATFDYHSVRKYEQGMGLINDPQIDLVDICLPTVDHFDFGKAALKKGKHVLIEKPLARTAREAQKLAKISATSKGLAMCGMCMRFWPGWTWLHDAIVHRAYGAVKSASFRRMSSHPGGPTYLSGDLSGGAILDLHIHDTDFIQYCFGPPRAVQSRGYSRITNAIDHVVTQYMYDDVPLVMAEASWCMAEGFAFNMQYTVNFERATAMFDLGAPQRLKLVRDGKIEPVQIADGMGYEDEIGYFVDCIMGGKQPQTVTLQSAALSIKIVEAELKSVMTGKAIGISA